MAPMMLAQFKDLEAEPPSNSQGSHQAPEAALEAQSMEEALRSAGVEHPEDIAALETKELAELLAPATFTGAG